jgi:hypothetical protein
MDDKRAQVALELANVTGELSSRRAPRVGERRALRRHPELVA